MFLYRMQTFCTGVHEGVKSATRRSVGYPDTLTLEKGGVMKAYIYIYIYIRC